MEKSRFYRFDWVRNQATNEAPIVIGPVKGERAAIDQLRQLVSPFQVSKLISMGECLFPLTVDDMRNNREAQLVECTLNAAPLSVHEEQLASIID